MTAKPPNQATPSRKPDPEVLARRTRIRTWVAIGKRIGYGSLGVSVVAFVLAAVLDFPNWTVTIATTGLVVACIALPGAIVFGYGILAAEREERGGGSFH